MKKSYLLFIIPLAVFMLTASFALSVSAQVQVLVCPAGYTCKLSPCPEGYTCIPTNNQPSDCPSGYICELTTATSTPIIPINLPVGCFVFSSNLQIGSRGADVVALQTLLIQSGFDISSAASSSERGYFGSKTFSAVKKFQESYGIVNPGTGFVGPLTRQALNSISCAIKPPVQ